MRFGWALLAILLVTPAWADETPVARLTSVEILEGGKERVRSLDWTPDGRRLAAGCSDRALRLWKPGAAKPVSMKVLPPYG